MSESNSNCFLCLGATTSANDNCEELRKYFFALKYINFFPPKYENNENNIETALLKICEECQMLLKRLSELVKLLEITEMKVDSCLKQIQDVMIKKNSGIQNDLNSKTESLRKNLIEKTSMKLKRSGSQPIVKISRMGINDLLSTKFCSGTSPSLSLEPPKEEEHVKMEVKLEDYDVHLDLDLSNDSMDVENYDCDSDHPIDDGNWENSDELEEQEHTLEDPLREEDHEATNVVVNRIIDIAIRESKAKFSLEGKNAKTSSNDVVSDLDQICCPYCRAKFKKTRSSAKRIDNNYGSFKLRLHMLQYHSEHFFPNHRLESVSEAGFQKIIVELLFEDLIEGRSCAFCPRPINLQSGDSSKKRNYYLRLKLHYVDEHYNELEKKLEDIQKDPDLWEKLSKCNPFGTLCSFCGIYIQNREYSRSHRHLFCRLSEGIVKVQKRSRSIPHVAKIYPVSETDDERNVKCNLCEAIFRRHYTRTHLTKYCKGSMNAGEWERVNARFKIA